MSQNTLIVSNWKMNLNLINSTKLISKLKILKISKNIKNIVCPQYLLIPHIRDLIKSSQIILGAQDCHFEEKGPFTGDSSILLIKDYGCKYVIIGHSERRQYHKEDNLDVKKKIKVSGPFSADTVFLKENRKNFNVIVGMYHDQVLAPMKSIFGFDAINITIGLPFIRISPDHGPNYKMFGLNKSNPDSLIQAFSFVKRYVD